MKRWAELAAYAMRLIMQAAFLGRILVASCTHPVRMHEESVAALAREAVPGAGGMHYATDHACSIGGAGRLWPHVRTRCVSLKKASLHWPVKLRAEPAAGAMRSIMQNQYRWRSHASSSQQRHARGSGACDSAMNANCFEKGMIHLREVQRGSHLSRQIWDKVNAAKA